MSARSQRRPFSGELGGVLLFTVHATILRHPSTRAETCTRADTRAHGNMHKHPRTRTRIRMRAQTRAHTHARTFAPSCARVCTCTHMYGHALAFARWRICTQLSLVGAAKPGVLDHVRFILKTGVDGLFVLLECCGARVHARGGA